MDTPLEQGKQAGRGEPGKKPKKLTPTEKAYLRSVEEYQFEKGGG